MDVADRRVAEGLLELRTEDLAVSSEPLGIRGRTFSVGARSGLLNWLRSELHSAIAIFAVYREVDEEGMSLLDDALRGVLERGGRVRIVVPSDLGAGVVRWALAGATGMPATVLVTGATPPMDGCVLTYSDGTSLREPP
jgi:hypothetical protein